MNVDCIREGVRADFQLNRVTNRDARQKAPNDVNNYNGTVDRCTLHADDSFRYERSVRDDKLHVGTGEYHPVSI